MLPTVLFTESRNWRKNVLRQLESRMGERTFVYFKYVYQKLFDLRARDYYDVRNPDETIHFGWRWERKEIENYLINFMKYFKRGGYAINGVSYAKKSICRAGKV